MNILYFLPGFSLLVRCWFMPFWGAVGAIAGLAGLGLSWFQSQQAQEANEEAQRQQRRNDLLSNIISIAGGKGVTGFSKPIADYVPDYGGMLTQAGNIASNYGESKQQEAAAQKEQAYKDEMLRLNQINAGVVPEGATQNERDAAMANRRGYSMSSQSPALLPGEIGYGGGATTSIAPYSSSSLSLQGLAYPQENQTLYDEFGNPILRPGPRRQ